jgi:hypothetical protein
VILLYKIFEKFEMNEDEISFIKNATNNGKYGSIEAPKVHGVLANFYLAKQIERSAKAQDKSAKAMFWLSVAIGVFTAVQAVGTFF